MFGYVKPDSAELRVREYDFYRATYCGICRAMQAHTGVISSATLSYDSVFLALVRMLYTKDEKFEAEMRRCIAHPLKKRPMLKENDALIYTAKAFAVLTYYKMRDDLSDEGGAKRVLVSAARPVASHAVSLADMPGLEKVAEEKLSAITALERENCESADRPAALFGELLGEIFAYGLSGSDRTVTYHCGYALGRFIYCADAAEAILQNEMEMLTRQTALLDSSCKAMELLVSGSTVQYSTSFTYTDVTGSHTTTLGNYLQNVLEISVDNFYQNVSPWGEPQITSIIAGIIIPPIAATVAGAEPEIAAKNMHATIFTTPREPGIQPNSS